MMIHRVRGGGLAALAAVIGAAAFAVAAVVGQPTEVGFVTAAGYFNAPAGARHDAAPHPASAGRDHGHLAPDAVEGRVSAAKLAVGLPAPQMAGIPGVRGAVHPAHGSVLARNRALSGPLALRPADPATQTRVRVAVARLPLEFEANQGQTDRRVSFLCRTGAGPVFLTGTEMVIAVGGRRPSSSVHDPSMRGARPSSIHHRRIGDRARSEVNPRFPHATTSRAVSSSVTLRLAGANPEAAVTGEEPLPGRSNYFIGNNPAKWHTNVPHYARVRCRDVYPGVDVVYYGNQRQLEHDFVVKPGADPSSIALDVKGATGKLHVGMDGDLQIPTVAGQVTLEKPTVYQEIGGKRVPVSGGYVVSRHSGAPTRVGFRIARYDRQRSLVIDPVLVYSTYLGGSDFDYGTGITVDSGGAAYVTGVTASADFPTASPIRADLHGYVDAFVSKISPDGSHLVYSTYLGGSGWDEGFGIAVDGTGAAYVTGWTGSTDFPTASPLQPALDGGGDAFVSKISSDGTHLIYSTYLGGSGEEDSDELGGIAVDATGAAYVTGSTFSADFPTASPLQPALDGGGDAFVSKISPDGSHLVYSTYLGGSAGDQGAGIAVDSGGAVYVTGSTWSTNFPMASPIQAASGGAPDAFVSKISADGSRLMYSTYLGGSISDYGAGIAVDGMGAAYVTGHTQSRNFPTASPIQPAFGGAPDAFGDWNRDAFVSKISADGSRLVYSTYLGGSVYDKGAGIAVDGTGAAYVTGFTQSTDFPTASPLQAAKRGIENAFVTKISADGSHLVYSTYLGGSSLDEGYAIAVDAKGAAYIAGDTYSMDFPTASPLQADWAGRGVYGGDAFVAKISTVGVPPPVVMSFNPVAGPVETSVGISGSGFTGATAVAFHGTGASFTVDSDTHITATVPGGATTGPISITGPGGTGTSSGNFTVTAPTPPKIYGFWPDAGPVGTTVAIVGSGLLKTSEVLFNGTPAPHLPIAVDTEVVASVPVGATTGPITVRTLEGAGVTSTTPFTVQAAHRPIILIKGTWNATNYGYNEPNSPNTALYKALEDIGYTDSDILVFDQASDGSSFGGHSGDAPVAVSVAKLRADIKAKWPNRPHPMDVDIVAHSAGGLVARRFANEDRSSANGRLCRVHNLITLGAPYGGVQAAAFALGNPLTLLTPTVGDIGVDMWPWIAFKNQDYYPAVTNHPFLFPDYHMFYGNPQTDSPPTGYSLLQYAGQRDTTNYWGIAGYHDGPSRDPLYAAAFASGEDLLYDGLVNVRSAYGRFPGPSLSLPSESHFRFVHLLHSQLPSDDTVIQTLIIPALTGGSWGAAGSSRSQPRTDAPAALPQRVAQETLSAAGATDLPVPLDTGAQATFTFDSAGGSTFTLTGPGGVTLSPVSTGAGIAYSESGAAGNTTDTYTLTPGAVGTWTMHVAPGPTGTGQGVLLVTVTNMLSLTAGAAQTEYPSGASAGLQTSLTENGAPLTGATVIASVQGPTGQPTTLTLFDDGAHGDGAAGDGVYAGSTGALSAGGIYNVSVQANGKNAAGEAFQRVATTFFTVAPTTASLTHTYSDAGLDTNADGVFEALKVSVGLNVTQAGSFFVQGDLVDPAGSLIGSASCPSTPLSAGAATLPLQFGASDILSHKQPGPWRVTNVRLYDDLPGRPIWMETDSAGAATSAYTLAQFDHPPVITWTQPAAAGASANRSFTVELNASDPDNAATFDLYSNTTPSTTGGTLIASGIPADGDRTVAWDTGALPAGSYSLYAVASDGIRPAVTSLSPGTVTVAHGPAAPAPVKAVAGNGQVALSWSAAAGAQTYSVKRATASGGAYDILSTTVTGTSYTDQGLTNGTTYFYVVSATAAGVEGPDSAEVSATPLSSLVNLPTFAKGLAMVSVPFDYSATSVDAAAMFGIAPVNGITPIAAYDPAAAQYLLYPNLPGANGKQTIPGKGYWILEASAQPLIQAGAAVTSLFDAVLQPGWNLIGNPFLHPIPFSSVTIRTGASPVSLAAAQTSGLVGPTIWTWDDTQHKYVAVSTFDPFVGYWIYIDSAAAQGGAVTTEFSDPASGP